MSAGIAITGLDAVRSQFAEAARLIEAELDRQIKPEFAAMRTQLQSYPAKRPRQTYIRTGTLGRGWAAASTYVVGRGGVTARLTNQVRYAPYVQTDRGQPWFHRGRWINTVEQVQQAFAESNARALQRAADRVAKQLG